MVAAWNTVKELYAFTIPVQLDLSTAAYEVAKIHVGLYSNFISADFMCLASFIESLEFQFGGLFGIGCPVQ